jgi:hypothetical protein
MEPRLVAAALGDGRDAGVLLESGGVRKAFAALAECDEEPGRERCMPAPP